MSHLNDEDGGEEPPPPSLPLQRLPSSPSFSPTFSPPPPGSPLPLDDLRDGEGAFFGTESLNDVRDDL